MDIWREEDHVCIGRRVAVVGNYGLLGQWLVRKLLEKGYYVHSALGCSPEEAAEMMSLPCAEQLLELRWRDLLDYTSITDVIEGCSAVFLTIPPCDSLNGLPHYPADVVDAEVRGTLNVVEACASTASVKRLVLTSSASAVAFDTRKDSNMTGTEKPLDERSWSNVDFCRKSKAWSAVAKTVAEKAAWSLARDRGVKLLVMNPAIVVSRDMIGMTKCTESVFPNVVEGLGSGVMAFAHVDTVADAHILAMESLDAYGRFLCFERLLAENEVVGLMTRFNPNKSLSRLKQLQYTPLLISNDKIQRLGLRL
ncbi:unnamed protein product [Calypogeia fissa]